MTQPSLRLYHAAPSRSSTVHWMLEELGEPYALEVLDLEKGESRSAAYLAVNPMGKVPALVHDGVLVTEVGAICLYLADAYPGAGLAPPVGDPRRGPYLRWMFFQGNCLEPALIDKALGREPARAAMMPYGDLDTTVETLTRFVGGRGPWLLGDQFTALDVYLGSAIRWTLKFGILPERDELKSFAAQLSERPASQRAEAKDAEIIAARKG